MCRKQSVTTSLSVTKLKKRHQLSVTKYSGHSSNHLNHLITNKYSQIMQCSQNVFHIHNKYSCEQKHFVFFKEHFLENDYYD